jgi:redox-sensitive bicupin YhaK (pirin superfamily)
MELQPRRVASVVEPEPVLEGAGVRLRRSIATRTLDYVDPFLLFDDFSSSNPDDYMAGFPMHPHRGIETVTYMLAGAVRHGDSLGNSGVIEAGDVQWMTAGGGIMHEEMPQQRQGKMTGFQLWVNLPARLKMTSPRYQEIPSAGIPELERDDGTKLRVIAGRVDGTQGAVTEIAADPCYLDVSIPARSTFSQPVQRGHTSFAYLFQGIGAFGLPTAEEVKVSAPRLLVFGEGDFVEIRTGDKAARLLLISGKPLHEPIARYGPFVMNTREEIQQALADLRNGTFVR